MATWTPRSPSQLSGWRSFAFPTLSCVCVCWRNTLFVMQQMFACAYNYKCMLGCRVIPAYFLPQHLLLQFEAEDQLSSGEPGPQSVCAKRRGSPRGGVFALRQRAMSHDRAWPRQRPHAGTSDRGCRLCARPRRRYRRVLISLPPLTSASPFAPSHRLSVFLFACRPCRPARLSPSLPSEPLASGCALQLSF